MSLKAPVELSTGGFTAWNNRLPSSLVLAAVPRDISCRLAGATFLHSKGADGPMTSGLLLRAFAVSAVLMTPGAPALAASCGTGSFEAWLSDFKNEAAAKGISHSAIASGLSGVTLDQDVLYRDRLHRVDGKRF